MNTLKLKDTFERVVATAVQSVIVYLVAANNLHIDHWKAVLAAAFPAAVNVILQAASGWMIPSGMSVLADTILRAFRTFWVGFLGTLAATAPAFDLYSASAWKAAAIGGCIAALAVVKGGLATFLAAREAKKAAPTPKITPASLAKAA